MSHVYPEKPYYAFGRYLRERYGCRVRKVSIDAGFTCPNLDGTKGRRGCLYCSNEGFSVNSRKLPRPIEEQIAEGIAFYERAFKAEKFFAYFQAFSNTYAPLPVLRERYEVIRHFPRIVGLSVGTRPDCVSRPVIELLAHFCETHEVWVEYGLQSAHDATLRRVNRGHRVADFLEAVERTRPFGIRICAHVILGLPGEDREMMMETARFLAGLPIDGVKIHLLHIMRGTPYETMYRQGKIGVLSEGAYVSLVCDFLERLPPHFTIQRLTANAPPDILVAPAWCRSQRATRNAIEAELRRRKSFQGKVFLEERRGGAWRAGAAAG